MFACAGVALYDFRPPPKDQTKEILDSRAADKSQEKVPDGTEYILCRQCHNIITTPSNRISVQGSHQHTFANPHGIVFEIGCFGAVTGCGYAGPASDEFTWFPGFSWRVAVCGRCLIHLGWLFTSKGFESFHGLILDHLITQKGRPPGGAE